jgi:Flp pilus assembly protein TadB
MNKVNRIQIYGLLILSFVIAAFGIVVGLLSPDLRTSHFSLIGVMGIIIATILMRLAERQERLEKMLSEVRDRAGA